jgi:hypothetical protein
MKAPDPLIVSWRRRQVRIRHGSGAWADTRPRFTPGRGLPLPFGAMADHDEELDVIVAELERAGLVGTYTQADGRITYRGSAQGAHVGRMLRWLRTMSASSWTPC